MINRFKKYYARVFPRNKHISMVSSQLLDNYEVDNKKLLIKDGKVPLTYWVVAPNFGDLLSPWLFEKLAKKPVSLVKANVSINKNQFDFPAYIGVGSVLSRAQDTSTVWGTGSFGTEQNKQISKKANYTAVRGPLTRCLVKNQGVKCPKVYGDPALLSPLVYDPDVAITHEIGVVLRWSEDKWLNVKPTDDVKLIDLGTDDVEGVIREMKSCRKIITSSLHGLIIADTYGIPNAWLASSTPKGGEFKFYDYFLSVNKVRNPHHYDVEKNGLSLQVLNKHFNFPEQKITFDYKRLLDACPFLTRKG